MWRGLCLYLPRAPKLLNHPFVCLCVCCSRNKHGVSRQKIAKMLERFELPITVDIVLNSQEPPRQYTEHAFKQQMKRRRNYFQ